MRIALVTDWYEPRIGGIELHLRDLTARYQRLTSEHHLPEIHGHAVENRSRLCVGVDMFVASPSNSRRTAHQLRDHKNDYRKDRNRYEQFDKGEAIACA